MKKTAIFAAFLTLLLGSCSSNSSVEPDINGVDLSDSNYITLEEALRNAEDLYSQLYGPGTRSARKAANVENFRTGTRSSEGDELYGFYVVNYENDEGFALLSADRRREAVYAISDEGSLHLSDTIENKGLSWYLNEHLGNSEAYASITPVNPPVNPIDTTISGFTGTKKFKTDIYAPLLTGILRQFHENTPYNMLCKDSNGSPALVGCYPLTIGTVMGYYEWPNAGDEYEFDWTSMKAGTNLLGWAQLFEMLGREEYINMDYDYDQPQGVMPFALQNSFAYLGYTPPSHSYFNYSSVTTELKNGNPVICDGISSTSRHPWVMDGAYTIITNVMVNGLVTEISFSRYFDCIWGWGTSANGYFLYGTTIGGTPDELGAGATEGSVPYFKDLEIYYGYRPNK